MQWICIAGSWRKSNAKLVSDVQSAVREIFKRGDGILTGGALGVDYFAAKEALKLDPAAKRVKITIPSSLETYAAHYRQRAREGVITVKQAEALIEMLTVVKNKNALTEMTYTRLNEESYYARNTELLKQSDALLAFQVNQSAGTQDTIDKARGLGMPVQVKRYEIA